VPEIGTLDSKEDFILKVTAHVVISCSPQPTTHSVTMSYLYGGFPYGSLYGRYGLGYGYAAAHMITPLAELHRVASPGKHLWFACTGCPDGFARRSHLPGGVCPDEFARTDFFARRGNFLPVGAHLPGLATLCGLYPYSTLGYSGYPYGYGGWVRFTTQTTY